MAHRGARMRSDSTRPDRGEAAVRHFWDRIADDWKTQVGNDGDANRILNSDPVLWRFVGDVRGLAVLDAGCGTGYLTRKLHDLGAAAVGIDLSERMIRIAHAAYPNVDFRVDSCSSLSTIGDARMDVVISNYVLMDTPDLEAAVRSFHRVLKKGGAAVLIFSHPCFPSGRSMLSSAGGADQYSWHFPYFERRRCTDPPWRHFTVEFPWFHRPLSDYWKAFTGAGFSVIDFEEPRVQAERYHLAPSAEHLEQCRTRPNSVAFKLRK